VATQFDIDYKYTIAIVRYIKVIENITWQYSRKSPERICHSTHLGDL